MLALLQLGHGAQCQDCVGTETPEATQPQCCMPKTQPRSHWDRDWAQGGDSWEPAPCPKAAVLRLPMVHSAYS